MNTHALCSYCAGLKQLTGQGVVGLHYLPVPATQPVRRRDTRVRRRCPGSFRRPRGAER